MSIGSYRGGSASKLMSHHPDITTAVSGYLNFPINHDARNYSKVATDYAKTNREVDSDFFDRMLTGYFSDRTDLPSNLGSFARRQFPVFGSFVGRETNKPTLMNIFNTLKMYDKTKTHSVFVRGELLERTAGYPNCLKKAYEIDNEVSDHFGLYNYPSSAAAVTGVLKQIHYGRADLNLLIKLSNSPEQELPMEESEESLRRAHVKIGDMSLKLNCAHRKLASTINARDQDVQAHERHVEGLKSAFAKEKETYMIRFGNEGYKSYGREFGTWTSKRRSMAGLFCLTLKLRTTKVRWGSKKDSILT